jgi:1-Cys peroxiredoxin 6
MSTFSLRLGETVPDFHCKTTYGVFNFHDFVKKDADRMPFTGLMSHPGDFTPVCTTELGRAETLFEEFKRRGAKLIGLSCDSVESHNNWSKDILHREGKTNQDKLSYPIIADESREIVGKLGMFDPRTEKGGNPLKPARALIIIDPECKVRLAFLYPAATGRNFDEILRTIDSLNITSKFPVATPVNWTPGQKVIVPPGVDESNLGKVESENLPSGRGYLRYLNM